MTEPKPPKDPSGRRHERTKMRARLKMVHPSIGDLLVYTADLSDGGLFILNGGNALPEVGEVVRVQVQDMPGDAPILNAKVVRHTGDGIGVMFISADEIE